MGSNKKYIISSLATQMILIPVVFTILYFAILFLEERFHIMDNAIELSGNAEKLVLFFVTILVSLIIGGVIGLVFSKLSNKQMPSDRAKYLTPIIPIVYALVFATLAAIFSKGNSNSIWWGIYVFKNPFFIIFDFILLFTGAYYIVPIAEIMAYAGFATGVFLYGRFAGNSFRNRASGSIKLLFGMVCLSVIVFTGLSNSKIINKGMTELLYGQSIVGKDLTEFDLVQIAPFKENNGLAVLDKEAPLQFAEFDEMPRLDGATALYPVYAAYVQAVYKGLGDYYEENKINDTDKFQKDIFYAFVCSESHPLDIVKCTKTNSAYDRLIHGQTDVIFVLEPSKAQVDEIKARKDEFVLTPIGSEAFIFFTNKQNPVENLKIKQIQDIYAGRITNWKEVGGQSRRVLPFQRPENSGSQTIMQNRVMKDIKMMEPTKETYAGGMGEVISRVSEYTNAKNSIGYSFMYYSSSMIKNNQIKYISVDGVKPTPDTVRDNSYPFTVPLYAVTLKSNTNPNISRLLDWVLSYEGQSLLEKTGYIPLR